MNPAVNWFFDKETPWKQAYAKLRAIALGSGLAEELKWGCPCYTTGGKNVVLIHGFKHYCALLFHKGALLTDDRKILVRQTANVQSARQIRFTSADEVARQEPVLRAYLAEAAAVEQSGRRVALKSTSEYPVPEEFAVRLNASPALKQAFQALTPGRQRQYLLHFAAAKQSRTRQVRIERNIPRILAGEGLDESPQRMR